MSKVPPAHMKEIENTLRKMIAVQAVDGGFLADPGFWARCSLINKDWREQPPNRVYVDGYVGGCMWNSWRVMNDALEDGIHVYYGFALGDGQWSEHCWCMIGDRIIETTGPMTIYYGAELTEAEWQQLHVVCHRRDPLEKAGACSGRSLYCPKTAFD